MTCCRASGTGNNNLTNLAEPSCVEGTPLVLDKLPHPGMGQVPCGSVH